LKISELLNKAAQNSNSVFLYSAPLYQGEKCYYCTSPAYEYNITSIDGFTEAFKKIESLKNTHVSVCLMKYEAGYLFEPSLNKYLEGNNESWLIKVLSFEKNNCLVFDSSELEYDKAIISGEFSVNDFKLNENKEEYDSAIEKVKKYIYQGDTYQVNYTLKGKFGFSGNPVSLFLNLISNQSTKYSAFINLEDETIISISPELFFQIDGSKIITRPMKGTIRRGINLQDDNFMKEALIDSAKDRAENVMIVDLLRNDFGRISRFGTVKAESLFDVEKYETVYQMVSTVEGESGLVPLHKIIENVFPCGSITGAPKIRTMEIINELEKEKRRLYTGSIGVVDGDKALFNVAIRTLVINKESGYGEVGLGGGIVWDSIDDKEYNEVKLKGKFLTRRDEPFQLIETMLFENREYFLLDYHLERLKTSADYFLFVFDELGLSSKLSEVSRNFNGTQRYRIRVLLNKYGKIDITWNEIEEKAGNVKVGISNKKISTKNKFQYFKTTSRMLYNSEFKASSSEGFFDILFFNEKGELAEGAITNVFIMKNGLWSTPPVSAGILDGCYRKHFLNTVNCTEKTLYRSDLISADKILLVNSLRKEIEVKEIVENGDKIWPAKLH